MMKNILCALYTIYQPNIYNVVAVEYKYMVLLYKREKKNMLKKKLKSFNVEKRYLCATIVVHIEPAASLCTKEKDGMA